MKILLVVLNVKQLIGDKSSKQNEDFFDFNNEIILSNKYNKLFPLKLPKSLKQQQLKK